MSRNKLLTKIERYYIVLFSIIPLVTFSIALIRGNTESYTNSAFFVAYFVFICFTLPSLLSKNFFKQNFFSLTSALCFLYFPAVYITNFVINNLFGFDFNQIYLITGILTIFLWHIFFTRFILKEKISKVEKTFSYLLYTLIPFIIFTILVVLIRDYGSIISIEVLKHKIILNGMQEANTIGITSASYWNISAAHEYSILMYHTLLNMITTSFSLPYHLVSYFTDLCFTLIFSLIVFKFFLKYYSSLWAILGTALTLLVFDTLAYTPHFFLPQTLAFLFFLKILTDKKLTLGELFLSTMLLILTHFSIGIFLAILLFTKHFYFEKKLKKKGKKKPRFLFLETFLLFSFVALLNAAGFSIEKYFQTETIRWFGNLTNPDFTGNFLLLFNLLGASWLLLLYACFKILRKKKGTIAELIGYFGLSLSLIIYFLSPAFASQFLLGLGFFSSLLVISLLSSLNSSKYIKIGLFTIILLAYALNFSNQFLKSTQFLEDEDYLKTALLDDDETLTKFWQEEKPDCLLISDPHTQLIIHSMGEGITAGGPYMNLNSRKKLADFVRKPSQEKLDEVKEINELENTQNEDICIGISQRLIEMAESNREWEESISKYQLKHKRSNLEINHEVFNLLDTYSRIYFDEYHAIFLIRISN